MADGGTYTLSAEGEALARSLREERPAMWYWYTDYYTALPTSPATAAFCARVYGRDLGQHGYMDLPQLDALLAAADLGPASRVLDLGCGDGRIAEYVSDTTGARRPRAGLHPGGDRAGIGSHRRPNATG